MPSPATVITLLSVATVAAQVTWVLLLLFTLGEATGVWRGNRFVTLLDRYSLPLLLLFALVATGGSLYFSEIAHWTPCKECWFQRIFMYPQVPILFLALLAADRRIAPTILALCLIGSAFSVHQYIGQVQTLLSPELAQACGDPNVDCNATEIFTFGYITIPLMALTAFAMNALLSVRMMVFSTPRASASDSR